MNQAESIARIILILLVVVFLCYLAYLFYFGITVKMARRRHRDPLGWVLLGLFVSPPLIWIILLIAGDSHDPR